jgi:hypothetical protein
MDGTGRHHVKWSNNPGSERQKVACFLSFKTDPNTRIITYIHTYIHIHTSIYIIYTEHVSNSGAVTGDQGEGKEENDRVQFNFELHHICVGTRHKEMHWKLEQYRIEEKGKEEW